MMLQTQDTRKVRRCRGSFRAIVSSERAGPGHLLDQGTYRFSFSKAERQVLLRREKVAPSKWAPLKMKVPTGSLRTAISTWTSLRTWPGCGRLRPALRPQDRCLCRPADHQDHLRPDRPGLVFGRARPSMSIRDLRGRDQGVADPALLPAVAQLKRLMTGQAQAAATDHVSPGCLSGLSHLAGPSVDQIARRVQQAAERDRGQHNRSGRSAGASRTSSGWSWPYRDIRTYFLFNRVTSIT